MKILAVRGKNLASLPGFEVDFESDPLAEAGLFAITGPTGAGKSTLLDALCLALYDRTPRLTAKRQAAPVGHPGQDQADRLSAYDPRLLLRNGTASGFAEVDFVGCDGGRYRSRWEVHRARKRVSGRVQNQSISLHSLDTGKALGGTKTETLSEIEDRLGLSFDQFRRSVLLAQGDFAAFLRADKNERADLLERMTGTEIYGRISQMAYRLAVDEQTAVGRMQEQAEQLAVLGPEGRRTVEAELATARLARQGGEKQVAGCEAACRHHQRSAELLQALEAANSQLAAADQAWNTAEPRRRELE
ncbi:MAG: AAA family ATPase, partial [Deltaproteobacteria bacterium]|nr:AAA family ATPase [Deltaproteobacteria bacterium]